MTQTSHSTEETKKIAKEFARTLEGGEFIALKGELGAGKTTFVQGLAEAFGVTDPVRSPTFTIMNIYKADRGAIKKIVHLDCYRLDSCQDLNALELEEWLNQPDTIIVTEWPFEEMSNVQKPISIEITMASLDERRIIINVD